MAEIPGPALYGTIGWIIGCILLLIIMKVLQASGRLSKDNTGIAFTVIIMSCISTWMLWLMAWFHQWHPLITPEFP